MPGRRFLKAETSPDQLASNLIPVLRLFFRHPRSRLMLRIYNCYFSRKPLHYFAFLVRLFYRHRVLPLCPSYFCLSSADGPISECPGEARQYIILAVSLFLRTKAGWKLEKPRHAHNGRNPGVAAAWPLIFPVPVTTERNLARYFACLR